MHSPRILLALLMVIGCGCASSRDASEAASPSTSTSNPEPTSGSSKGTLTTWSFHSKALGVDKSYVVYLPADYDSSSRRYPVVYMLHGLGGDEGDWPRMGLALAADSLSMSAIIVMLDGDDSFYVDRDSFDYEACLAGSRPFGPDGPMETYCVRTANYETYVARDVVSHIDATYRTIANRDARAIGGLSMGGFGALMIAMRHKELFSSAASHSGVLALLYKGPYPYQAGAQLEFFDTTAAISQAWGRVGGHLTDVLTDDMGNWRSHDPASLVRSLHNGELALYIDCGTEDDFRLHETAAYLHDILVERGVDHEFVLAPGKHDPKFWADRIDDSLQFHKQHFAAMAKGSRKSGN